MRKSDLVKHLPVSVRLIHVMEYYGVKTVGQLLSLEDKQLVKMRNLGRKCMDEIEQIRKQYKVEELDNNNLSKTKLNEYVTDVRRILERDKLTYSAAIRVIAEMMIKNEVAIMSAVEDYLYTKVNEGEIDTKDMEGLIKQMREEIL